MWTGNFACDSPLSGNGFGNGFRVAPRLWFRLFGTNGPDMVAELHRAFMAAPGGEGINDGRFLARLQNKLDQAAVLPDRQVAQGRDQPGDDRVATEHAVLASALVAAQDLVAAPAPGLELTAPAIDASVPSAAPALADSAAIAGPGGDRSASLYLSGIVPTREFDSGRHSPFAGLDLSVPYAVLGDMEAGLVVDTRNKTLLPGGPGDYPQLGAAPNDTVELSGDYSAGFAVAIPEYVEQIVARAGHDYNLIADDSGVAAGGTLTINATPLGAANNMIFDGSGETDGRFIFLGSDSADVFLGSSGNDVIHGEGGADTLTGGGGSDTFVYLGAGDSTGAAYDTLADFNPAQDKIDLPGTVTGFDTAIQSGALSTGSFSADLATALSGLGAGHAVVYAPDSGDLAGKVFLVVDANGVAGYQEGEDYVFALPATTLADLSTHPNFFV